MRFENIWVLVQNLLDFFRVHVLPSADNHVFGAAHNVAITALVNHANIALLH